MHRGDIHELRPPRSKGHEQQGRRFGVILQADVFLPRSVVIVAPTSQSARPATFRPEIEVRDQPTRLLVEQLGAVDTSRLGRRVGRVTPEEQWEIDDALRLISSLD
ncbi:MAG: type II toxin-antitoxin system PemK/MazF family toxin [Actinomycetota bacterium]|nr:type II toxin-antitoxin system PemK/MazF family toxin [Actinomycetota bacterium]